jgi:hypothetical protein
MRARSCDVGSMAQKCVVGSGIGWGARVKRLRRMLEGDHRRWNHFNLEVLRAHAGCLAEEALLVHETFSSAQAARSPWGASASDAPQRRLSVNAIGAGDAVDRSRSGSVVIKRCCSWY